MIKLSSVTLNDTVALTLDWNLCNFLRDQTDLVARLKPLSPSGRVSGIAGYSLSWDEKEVCIELPNEPE
jgi:hypothetical protein